jgi:hypothetical protein
MDLEMEAAMELAIVAMAMVWVTEMETGLETAQVLDSKENRNPSLSVKHRRVKTRISLPALGAIVRDARTTVA